MHLHNIKSSFLKYKKYICEQYDIFDCLFLIGILVLISVIIDYFNQITWICNKFGMPIIICVLILIFIKLFSLKVISLLSLKSINYCDFYNISILGGTIGYFLIAIIFNKILYLSKVKVIICIIIFIITVVFLLYRVKILSCNQNEKSKNVYSLKELYDNTIPDDVEFIFINDEEADYDLLNRNYIISQITNTIINCHYNSKFVMSLKGEWGSGKTTILKNVKRKLLEEKNRNIVFIDTFEPWSYNDDESLVYAFFDVIMENIGCGFRINDVNIFTKVYLKTIMANTKWKIDDFLKLKIDVARIKKIINNYLIMNDKKIVLVLDNLERCSSKQILFILKIIHNLFDFNNFIYILSYDDSEMKNHFEKHLDINYSYLEKIIQLEFSVPQIDQDILQKVITKCLNNYLAHTSLKLEEDIIQQITKILCKNTKNLRDLKRLINSTFSSCFQNNKYLNSVDMLLLEFLSLHNYELWHEIFLHKEFYISEDRYVNNNEYIFNSDRYNRDTTNYFKELFTKRDLEVTKYTEVLSILFPNVETYLENLENAIIEFIPKNSYVHDPMKHHMSVVEKRVYNAKFFDLYFNKSNNEFVVIDDKIQNFINTINQNELSVLEIEELFLKMSKVYPGWVEKFTMETFQLYVDKIDKEKILLVAKAIFNTCKKLNKSVLFVQLNSFGRSIVVISKMLTMLNDNEFNLFLYSVQNDYKNIDLINKIKYYLSPERTILDFYVKQENFEKINELYQNMYSKIVNEKINIYDFKYFSKDNIWLFFKEIEYIDFLKTKMCTDNLMLLLIDSLVETESTKQGYYILKKELIDTLYGFDNAKSDIYRCPNSKLKDFLIGALKNVKFEKQEYIYEVDEITDIDKLYNDFLIDIGNKSKLEGDLN